MGLALGCVVLGLNGNVDEKLSELQGFGHGEELSVFASLRMACALNLSFSNENIKGMANAMEQHYGMLLASVLFLFLAILAFTSFSIFSSVFPGHLLTVRYLFYAMAVGGLVVILTIVLRWGRFSAPAKPFNSFV